MKFERLTNPKTIDKAEIINILSEGRFPIIQFDNEVYDDLVLSQINEIALECSSDLEIRFYGHNKFGIDKGFDCKVLLKLKNVKNVTLNCLWSIKNIEVLSELQNLEKLSIGVEKFKETEFLRFENLKSLNSLSIELNKVNLEHIKDYKSLKDLRISGDQKNYDSIGELKDLEKLSLRSTNKKKSIEFVNMIESLRELTVCFGSRESIEEITNPNIESLTIFWIRGLESTGALTRFKKLKKLSIENQAKIESIVFEKEMKDLELLRIDNCKGLAKIEGLVKLKSLKTILISRLPKIDFNDFGSKEFPASLEHINFYTSSAKKNQDIKDRIKALGYTTT